MATTITDDKTYQVLRYVFVYDAMRRDEPQGSHGLLPAPYLTGGGQVSGVL